MRQICWAYADRVSVTVNCLVSAYSQQKDSPKLNTSGSHHFIRASKIEGQDFRCTSASR